MRSFVAGLAGFSFSVIFACSSSPDEAPVQQVMEPATPAPGATEPGNMPAASGDGAMNQDATNSGSTEAQPMDTPLQSPTPVGNGSGPAATPPAEDDADDTVTPPATDPEPPAATNGCPAGPFAASPLLAAVTPRPVCTGMTFTEGAVWFAQQNTLFFSDVVTGSGRIMSFTPGGMCQEFIANAGTNGLVIAPDGNLLAARHGDQTLTVFDLTTKQPTVLVADNGGLAFNSPNDIAVRSDGNLYFTDPNYLLAGRRSEQPARAYRRDPGGALTVIDQNGNTNGVTLSPDETKLYLSHLGNPNDILVFDVDAAGALSNSRQFVANVGSDGMAIDCAGNLYVTQGGVRVYAPDGNLIGTIAAPGAANVAFGGPERKTLYITATTSLLALELAIPGLPY